ncbi:MAG: ATP-binding cassette domain-containing protein [Acidobacteriota bacterium]
MNVVECRNVTKRFDEFIAVKELSFEVKKGSIFGLLGPNGAGKTTTLRMIVNIYAPDSGEITVLGEPASPQVQAHIGYLPEERGLYKKMRVGEQLLLFARLRGVERSEAVRRIDRWLDRLELTEWRNKNTDELSKGMQQKVQFIATILAEPSLLILDEPFSGLDPVSVNLLKSVILELHQQGKTIIFSSHQMEQVERMCDDICLVDHASKVLSGSLREIKRQFSRNAILLDYEGADSFLTDSLVKRVTRQGDYVEVMLADGANPQDLLRQAITTGVSVNRFERIEASLNEIFIESVTKKNGKNNNTNSA